MPKRIHELAKEWNLQSKELLAGLETIGITGKRSQSSLQEPDVERLATHLGRGPAAQPTVGTERVVGERMVTEKDAQGEVTSRESTVEARVRPNVIRRRRRRVDVSQRLRRHGQTLAQRLHRSHLSRQKRLHQGTDALLEGSRHERVEDVDGTRAERRDDRLKLFTKRAPNAREKCAHALLASHLVSTAEHGALDHVPHVTNLRHGSLRYEHLTARNVSRSHVRAAVKGEQEPGVRLRGGVRLGVARLCEITEQRVFQIAPKP